MKESEIPSIQAFMFIRTKTLVMKESEIPSIQAFMFVLV